MDWKQLCAVQLIWLMVGCGGDGAPAANDDDTGLGTSGAPDAASPDGGGDAASSACALPAAPDEEGLILIAAGAPLALFGPEEAPDFEGAFNHLATLGVDGFFPFFGRSEIDGVTDVSGHFEYFLPREFTATPRHCDAINPYEAARGVLGIVFPAFLFVDAPGDAALDEATFRDRYARLRDGCWGGDDRVILAHESFDEIALQRVVNAFFSTPGPRVENVAEAQRLLNELGDKPVLVVEGPAVEVIRDEPAIPDDRREELLGVFWDAVELSATGADYYGFDVYPVPRQPLTLLGDYTREANARAPMTQRLAVLQGFSREAESNGSVDERGPTLDEQRYMALDSIVAGATLLIWYGGSYLEIESQADHAEVWAEVEAVIDELRGLSPYLTGTRTPLEVQGDAEAVAFHNGDDAWTVVVVHRSPDDERVVVTAPEGVEYALEVRSEAALTVEGGALSLDMQGFEAVVLRGLACDPRAASDPP